MKIKGIILSICLAASTSSAFSSSYTPAGMYPDEIIRHIGEAAGKTRVNLQNKPLCLASEDTIFDPTKVETFISALPDSVKILDLSLNRLPETALPSFIPLLQRETFDWLDITTNSGADSMEGIRNLTTAMSGLSTDLKIKYLGKVIWVRKEHVGSVAERRILVEPFVSHHQRYYEEKERLDASSDVWSLLGLT